MALSTTATAEDLDRTSGFDGGIPDNQRSLNSAVSWGHRRRRGRSPLRPYRGRQTITASSVSRDHDDHFARAVRVLTVVAHTSVKDLTAHLEGVEPAGGMYDAKIKVQE